MGILGETLRVNERPDEALPALEATVALKRRYWPHNEGSILIAQSGLASGLAALGRHDEALVLKREIYTRRVATLGVSHETTLLDGNNLAISLTKLELWDESITLQRDQLLPAARRSLGADHESMLDLNYDLAWALRRNPERTRNDLC